MRVDIAFDYSIDSLISLWTWYESKIQIVEKNQEELEEQLSKYPDWLHNELSHTKISLETLKFGMDVAIFFAEVIIRNNGYKIRWGIFQSERVIIKIH